MTSTSKIAALMRDEGLEFALSVAVAIVALLLGLVAVVASGVSLGDGVSAFIDGAFGTQLNFAGTIAKMVPLTLVALGWIVVFRAGRFHVGFPGQLLFGSLLVSVVALKVSLPTVIHLPLCVIAGAVGGALYALLPAWLWAKRNVNEILSTLLLNLVAVQILAWWVRHPFHDSTTPLPLTPPLPDSSRWTTIITNTDLHWDVVLIPICVVAIAFLLSRTTFGFRTRVVGANAQVARQAGISPERIGTAAIVLSGALAGLAGSSLVIAGTTPAMGEDVGSTYGFTGIAVALLARNSPWGTIPAALLFAALTQGGGVMEGTVGISSSLVGVLQGIMIVSVLAATTILYTQRQRRRRTRTGSVLAARADAETGLVA
jgi:simple sugar transport system permease protein